MADHDDHVENQGGGVFMPMFRRPRRQRGGGMPGAWGMGPILPGAGMLGQGLMIGGQLGFGGQMQDAMQQMLAVNLANQSAVGRHKEALAPVLGKRAEADAAVNIAAIKAAALAKILGGTGQDRREPPPLANQASPFGINPRVRALLG